MKANIKSGRTGGMKNSIIYTLINAVMERSEKDRVIIAIDGPCAAGKTMFANSVKNNFDCNIFHMGDFFLPPEKMTSERLAEPGENVDWERFKDTVLENIVKGEPFTYRIYDRKSGDYRDSSLIKPKKLNIVEGVYSMHPRLAGYYDYKIFFDVSREKQLERLKQRCDIRALAMYKNQWIPLEDKYFDKHNGRAAADFSFNTTRAF